VGYDALALITAEDGKVADGRPVRTVLPSPCGQLQPDRPGFRWIALHPMQLSLLDRSSSCRLFTQSRRAFHSLGLDVGNAKIYGVLKLGPA
jgi:hypothetical protein